MEAPDGRWLLLRQRHSPVRRRVGDRDRPPGRRAERRRRALHRHPRLPGRAVGSFRLRHRRSRQQPARGGGLAGHAAYPTAVSDSANRQIDFFAAQRSGPWRSRPPTPTGSSSRTSAPQSAARRRAVLKPQTFVDQPGTPNQGAAALRPGAAKRSPRLRRGGRWLSIGSHSASGRWATPEETRSAIRHARPWTRWSRSTSSPSSAPGASACTTTISCRWERPGPRRRRSWLGLRRRSRRPASASGWRPTSSPIRPSRTEPSPPSTPVSARRSARRCCRSTWAPSWAPRIYDFWGGREGVEAGAAKDPRDALERYREAINTLAEYVVEQGYELRFAIEPKPERAARRHLPAHRRARAALHHHPGAPRDGGRQPRGRPRDDGRPLVSPCSGAGAVGGQAVPHRSQRAAHRALRPGLSLRRRGPQGGVPARPAAGARRL